jgi:hypothetical protein
MLHLLERKIRCVEERLILLAPPGTPIPVGFNNVDPDPAEHGRLLQEVQRLRGHVYLADGAIERRHLQDGLHRTPEDMQSWHLLMLDAQRRVTACAWYLLHERPPAAHDLQRVRDTPLARGEASRASLWTAVEQELDRARRAGLKYAELGGWAVTEAARGTTDTFILALSTFGLSRALGDALGLTTATMRHCSSTILRRLGGLSLRAHDEEIPPYYDPRYKCEMELLRFDSRRPSARYLSLVELLQQQLSRVSVILPSTEAVTAPIDVPWSSLLEGRFDTDISGGQAVLAGA